MKRPRASIALYKYFIVLLNHIYDEPFIRFRLPRENNFKMFNLQA